MELIIIETPEKVFVSDVLNNWSSSYLARCFFDGKKAEESFKKNWFVIDKIPLIVEKEVSQPDINPRYELIDESMASDKIKKRLEITEIKLDCEGYWKDEFAPLRSLYTKKSDPQPPIRQAIEWTIKEHKKIDTVLRPL